MGTWAGTYLRIKARMLTRTETMTEIIYKDRGENKSMNTDNNVDKDRGGACTAPVGHN
jgi:hypothetical protein